MPVPSSRKKLWITLAAPLVGLGGLELGLRLFGFAFESPEVPVVMWNPDRDVLMRTGEDMHVPDSGSLWTLRHGAVVPYGEEERIHSGGYRGPRLGAKEPGSLRVALLGESTIFGMGVPYAETCAARLQELLGEGAEVFTAGVVGFTVHQGLARYRDLVRGLEPDVVVIAFGVVNEANPAPSRCDRDRIAASRARASLLGCFLEWARLRTRTGQLADCWRIRRAGGVEAVEEQARAARARRRELRDTFGAADWPGIRRSSPGQYAECLAQLVREVRADGARPIVLQLPSHPDGWKQRPVLELYRDANLTVARAEEVQFLDMPRIVAGRRPNGDPRVLNFLQDGDYWHLNAAGHARLARAIEQHLKDPRAGRVSPESE